MYLLWSDSKFGHTLVGYFSNDINNGINRDSDGDGDEKNSGKNKKDKD